MNAIVFDKILGAQLTLDTEMIQTKETSKRVDRLCI